MSTSGARAGIRSATTRALPPAHSRFAADLRAQRDALVHPGFFMQTPWSHLQHVPRYLKALDRRLTKFLERPERSVVGLLIILLGLPIYSALERRRQRVASVPGER